jgi:hypothetical protein
MPADAIRATLRSSGDREVFDRLHQLTVILPGLANEAITARQHVLSLRSENARLLRRIAELQSLVTRSEPDDKH